MTREEIVAKVRELNLPKDSYIVFGSCPMAAAGIKEASDIDMLVSREVFEKLSKAGWQILDKGGKDKPLVSGVFEAHKSWEFSSYNPTLEHLLSTATVIDEIPFASLEEVRKWKAASARPKDLLDIKLIDEYISYAKITRAICLTYQPDRDFLLVRLHQSSAPSQFDLASTMNNLSVGVVS